MKTRPFLSLSMALVVTAVSLSAFAAGAPIWTGEYADKKFLNGQAVFQLSLTQEGSAVKVGFDAVYNDGHGCAPEAEGLAKVTGKNSLEFSFRDSSQNAGTGRIVRGGDDVILSLKTTRVANSECVVFYQDNIRLKRVTKK